MAGVQILDISCVKPLHPTHRRFNFYLPLIDTFYKGIGYIKDVLFYSLGDNGSSICNMQALKHGLSIALVDFYPVAGRLFDDADARELSIDCNDAGVEFVEAIIDRDFRELEEKSFPIHDFYVDLARLPKATGHQQDAALLSIQVTRFQDGCGIAIGIVASHVVFDGHSLWYFLNSWGQCCRGQGVSLRPFHVRAVMNPNCWLPNSRLPTNSLPTVDVVLPDHPSTVQSYHKVMHFDCASVQRLKQAAIDESGNMCISSFQAVIAFVWKRFTQAQDWPPHQQMCLNVGANVRQRLRPSLTDAYFGNAVEPFYIYATAGDLMRENIGAVAEWINGSLKVLEDQTYLRERLTINRVQKFNAISDEAVRGDTNFLFITHGSKFPVYDIDVGMGKPIAVRPPTIGDGGIVYVYPSREQGGIDVCVCFSSMEILDAFLAIPSPCVDI